MPPRRGCDTLAPLTRPHRGNFPFAHDWIGGVPDVARRMGIAETTIKTHLARIFTKTGTKRQADLVRLVAAFTPPIKI